MAKWYALGAPKQRWSWGGPTRDKDEITPEEDKAQIIADLDRVIQAEKQKKEQELEDIRTEVEDTAKAKVEYGSVGERIGDFFVGDSKQDKQKEEFAKAEEEKNRQAQMKIDAFKKVALRNLREQFKAGEISPDDLNKQVVEVTQYGEKPTEPKLNLWEQIVKGTVEQTDRGATMISEALQETPIVGNLMPGESRSDMIERLAGKAPNEDIATQIRKRGYEELLGDVGFTTETGRAEMLKKTLSDVGALATMPLPVGKGYQAYKALGKGTGEAALKSVGTTAGAGAAYTGIASMGEAEKPSDVIKAMLFGGGVSAAIPVVGATIAKGVKTAPSKIKSTPSAIKGKIDDFRTRRDTSDEAIKTELDEAQPKWYRGEDQYNKGGKDQFYSADESVAGDYGKVTQAGAKDLPKKPLTVTNKDELAETIGYKGDPMVTPKGMPESARFDTKAKKYAQSKGYDSIIYKEGSLGSSEMHRFGVAKGKTTGKAQPLGKPTPSKPPKELEPLAQEARKYKSAEEFVSSQTKDSYYHGTPSGEFGDKAVHIGTKKAAQEAIEARIGIPADGKGWTGNKKYGETLLAGSDTLQKLDPKGYNQTGFNVGENFPKKDFYLKDYPELAKGAKYGDGSPIPLDATPAVFPVRIKGKMTNVATAPLSDTKANAVMAGQLKKGTAKRGYYYKNIGEDEGSISAVVPSKTHLERLQTEQQLTDLYNQATQSTKGNKPVKPLPGGKKFTPEEAKAKTKESKPKPVKNIPTIGTPELAKGVKTKAIKAKLIYGFDKRFRDLPEYDKVNVKEQGRKATDLVLNAPDEAYRIAMGEKLPPDNILPESVFTAVEQHAIETKNIDVLRDLATKSTLTQEATGMGQRIRMLAERDPYSPVKAISNVQKARKEAVSKKLGKNIDKAVKETTAEIKKHIKQPSRVDWNTFIEGIKC